MQEVGAAGKFPHCSQFPPRKEGLHFDKPVPLREVFLRSIVSP